MLLLRHIAFALTYGAFAIAVALTLPYSVPGMERWTAVAIGALILIFGAVLHEVWSRHEREKALQGELVELTSARDAVLIELARAREEVRAIRGELLEQSRPARSLDEVKAEVQVLQQLVAQISAKPAEPESGAPRPPQPARQIDPHELAEIDVLALVRDAIRHDRIDMVLQPIVSLPQRKLRHHQAFSRIRNRDSSYLMPHRVADLVARAGLAATLDNVLLFRCVQLVRGMLRRHRSVNFFAKISMHSLRDGDFMGQFVEFMADNPELAPRLVLEFSIDDLRDALGPRRAPLDRLSEMGFRFCVDGFRGVGDFDLDLIGQNPVRFLKIDAGALLAMVDGPTALDVGALKQELDRAAIDLIVDGIENEQVLIEVLDLPIDYGQGRLFGDPGGAARTDGSRPVG